ncbi:glycoside hydrolase [Chytriomyces sp. MP71]|nr:glycoside hydrolase [Chytriomyces sp. MP71]
MGITILDALDTALVLKNETIFKKAAKWVIDGGLSMNADVNANVFETTIRVIGGLLSAHHLCDGPEKEGLLKQAVRVADKFMPAYETSKSGIPINSINLAKGIATSPGGQFSSTAEATTVQLELKYLSHLTGDPKYWNAAQKVSQVLYKGPQGDKTRPNDGLVPIYINPDTGDFVGSEFRLGSRADSYYEYLAKQYLQTNGTEPFFRDEYRFALHKGIKAHLLMRSAPSGLLYIRELMGPIKGEGARKVDKFDHLVCYVAGTMALAATKGKRVPLDPVERVKVLSGVEMEELYLAEELARSCYEMYRQTATGLASEIVFWRPAKDEVSTAKELDKTWARFEGKGNTGFPRALEGLKESKEGELLVDFDIHALDRHNLLRPEAVESFFVLWRITGDEKYREWGWRVFRSFEQWSKVPSGGYTSLNDVLIVPPPARDKMESFFLGETLKYFYLLFSEDSILPLDKYVFNTECHPLPIFEVTPEMRKKVIWMD